MKNLFHLVALAVLCMACDNKTSDPDNSEGSSSEPKAVHGKAAPAVQLNNGQKWQANAETTFGIQNMIRLANELPVNASLADYQALEKQMTIELNTLFEKCTMKGEAHNQLHNYLVPLQKMIRELESERLETSRANLEELKRYLVEYDTYFY